MNKITNEEMAVLIQNGDTSLIPALYDNMKKWLHTLSYRHYNTYKDRFSQCGVCIEDIKQECFFIFMSTIKAFDPTKDFEFISYINFQFKNHMRKLLNLRDGEQVNTDMLLTATSIDKPVNTADGEVSLKDIIKDNNITYVEDIEYLDYTVRLHEDLQKCIDTLSPDRQDIIINHYYNNMTFTEMAKINHCANSNITSKHHDSLRKLRQCKYASEMKRKYVHDDIIKTNAYKSSVSSFKRGTGSTTEKIIEKLERLGLF